MKESTEMARSDGFHLIPTHKTNNLILRWSANYFFHKVSMFFFRIGIKANEQIYESGQGYTIWDEIKEVVGSKLYKLFDIPYSKWGTTYKMDLSALNLDFDDGLGWDDYDEFGIPYWDYFWHEDPITGDAWRLVDKKSRDGIIK